MLRPFLASAVLLLGLLCKTRAQPRFEAFWDPTVSYMYMDDKQHNPWYINLGDLNTGGSGFIGGPNVVTVKGADFCVEGCQENYPDEFCSKYPPEGIPVKPRSVEDWGTKCNITSEVMTKGIAEIQAKGGKVILSFGGGISAQSGGGDRYLEEIPRNAEKFAERVKNTVEYWNFDGIDFYNTYNCENLFWDEECPGQCQDEVYNNRWNKPGRSVVYHSLVIRRLREALGPTKTISFTKLGSFFIGSYSGAVVDTVIAAAHHYLDFITVGASGNAESRQRTRDDLQSLGISLDKVGFLLHTDSQKQYWLTDSEVEDIVTEVKDYRMAGITLSNINMENNEMHGNFARGIAELLYF